MAGGGEHGTKAIVAAFFANLGIAVMKFLGFAFTGSGSMLAESIHSVADAGNQGLLLLGGRRARRPATPEHPFGYGRERYFWSFIVALVLFSLGAGFSFYEGVKKLRDPHDIESPEWALGILFGAILLEIYSFRTAIVEANKVRGDAGWWEFVRHSKSPELPVVLLEDLGALLGLVLAFTAVTLAVVTDDTVWDALGTLSIGTLLAAIAIILAVEMKALLMGESATPQDQRRLREAIESEPDVVALIHMRTQHLGPDELLVGAKVQFDTTLSVAELAASIDRVEASVRAAVPAARVMYLEPGVPRTVPGLEP